MLTTTGILGAHLLAGEDLRDLLGVAHRVAGDRDDHVTGVDAGGVGGPFGLTETTPTPTGWPDCVGHGGQLGEQRRPVRVGDPARGDQLPGDVGDHVGRDGEADARGGAAVQLGIDRGQRGDADDVAGEVDERAAAVAGIDRRRGLDGLGDGRAGRVAALRFGDRAADGGDDAVGHAAGEPQRVAERQHELPDLELRGVGERRRVHVAGVLHPDHGELVGEVAAHQRGRMRGRRVGIGDLELRRAAHHVRIRDDVALVVEHDAAP